MERLSGKTRLGICCVVALALLGGLPARAAAADWVWPVRGPVITHYINDDSRPYAGGMHRGIDIGAPVGTPVSAARAGEVTYAAQLGFSGLTVAVNTVDGVHVTSYLHLSSIAVRRGQRVEPGDRIGEVGVSGRRSKDEPHLHFGVRVAGSEHSYVDPLTLLPRVGGERPGPAAEPAAAPVPVWTEPVPVRVRAAPRRARPHAGQSRPARVPQVALPVPAQVHAEPRQVGLQPSPSVRHARKRAPSPAGPGVRTARRHLDRETSVPLPPKPPHVSDSPESFAWWRLLLLAGAGLLLAALGWRPLTQRLRRRPAPAPPPLDAVVRAEALRRPEGDPAPRPATQSIEQELASL